MTQIAAFSDLHLGAHYSPGSSWVRTELEARRPDVVVFGGDLFDRHTSGPSEETEGAALFRWITQDLQVPVVAIWGNHDVAKGFEFHTRFPTTPSAPALFLAGAVRFWVGFPHRWMGNHDRTTRGPRRVATRTVRHAWDPWLLSHDHAHG